MERYVYLTSGSSWIDEYGDPGENMKPKILAWSPYHQISEHSVENADVVRVALRMIECTRRMRDGSWRRRIKLQKTKRKTNTILYHEMTEGGHAGANRNRAKIKEND